MCEGSCKNCHNICLVKITVSTQSYSCIVSMTVFPFFILMHTALPLSVYVSVCKYMCALSACLVVEQTPER